jgi:hypothetical protein
MSLNKHLKPSNKQSTPSQSTVKEKPDETFLRLLNRVQPSEVVEIRLGGDVFRMRFRVLTYREQEACRTSARERLITGKKLKPEDFTSTSGAVSEIYQDAVATEVLFRAICRETMVEMPDGTKKFSPLFQDIDQMIGTLSPDEIVILFNSYTLVQEKLGPNDYAIFVKDNFDTWIKAVAEGAEYYPLVQLPLPILVETLVALAKNFTTHFQFSDSDSSGESSPATSEPVNSSSTEDALTSSNDSKQISKTEALKKALADKGNVELFSMEDAIKLAKKVHKE